ncbi:hypothetical protein UPYG_G00044190 [Umbra pygmaea]|uniref:VWA7 N-terminal domain-containing protein n=1 Tax=Umbra pygmaea TaxID=75934 RepID=A0ABD0XQN6_UMBPY
MAVYSAMYISLFLMALSMSLLRGTEAFKPLLPSKGSVTHRDITEKAILRKTAEVCRDLSAAQGWHFSLPIDDSLSISKLQKACSADSPSIFSSVNFHTSIVTMYLSNALVDLRYLLSDEHHFDGETFMQGRELITRGMSAVKAGVKKESFLSARRELGSISHTLQDFYSHSNWVELGNRRPYSTLIQPYLNLEKLAGHLSTIARLFTPYFQIKITR